MTEKKLKTVDEIMEMVQHAIALVADENYAKGAEVCATLRAAITDLHEAATRNEDSEYVMKDVEAPNEGTY